MEEESRSITVVSTMLGLLRYKRLTMGISSSSEIFQGALEEALVGLKGVKTFGMIFLFTVDWMMDLTMRTSVTF